MQSAENLKRELTSKLAGIFFIFFFFVTDDCALVCLNQEFVNIVLNEYELHVRFLDLPLALQKLN